MGQVGRVEVRPSEVPLNHAAFYLSHHPVGWYGKMNVALQRAATTLWLAHPSYSIMNLTHHPIGFFGPRMIPVQRAADVLWQNGID